MATLLVRATVSISGEVDDYEAHSDEIEDTVEEALIAAKNYIASKLGQLSVGPLEIRVEV